LDGDQYGALFYPAGAQTFAANRRAQLCGVWDSQVIEAPKGFVNWSSIDWTATVPAGTQLYFWTRTGPTGVDGIPWAGPYLNPNGSPLPAGSAFLQVRAVLYASAWPADPAPTPVLSQFSAKALISSTASVFYTAAFNMGFNPQYVLLTYNGTIPEGAVVRAAVAGIDSADPADYQFVEPGVVTRLNGLPRVDEKLKVMLQVLGRQDVEVTITDLALNASGDGQTHLNR